VERGAGAEKLAGGPGGISDLAEQEFLELRHLGIIDGGPDVTVTCRT
jgi:hypothetical protein